MTMSTELKILTAAVNAAHAAMIIARRAYIIAGTIVDAHKGYGCGTTEGTTQEAAEAACAPLEEAYEISLALLAKASNELQDCEDLIVAREARANMNARYAEVYNVDTDFDNAAEFERG